MVTSPVLYNISVCVCVRACMRMYTYMPTQACLTFCDPTDISPSPRRRNAKKAKWLSQEALQIAEKRREAKCKGERERYIHLNAEFQRIAKR